MDIHDKDDSMDEILGHIPPSLMIGSHQNSRLHLPTKDASYGSFMGNEQNFFEGMINHDGGIHNNVSSISHLATSSSSKPQLPMDHSFKRTLPSMNWTGDDDNSKAGLSLNKKFHLESNDGSIERTDGNGSIASLLSHLPQTTPLHQQSMLGSMGDGHGIFRPPFQLPGMNWY